MSDHPQLTAYLLGELSPAESAALEQQLAASPELQQELDALRQTVTAVQSAFAQYTDTQPAVPAIDREKLHALLRSAVVMPVERTSSSVPSRGPASGPTVAAPALLASTLSAPVRGSTNRGWLVAGAVLVIGGLIGLSQMETGHGTARDALVRSDPSQPEQELLLALNRESAVSNGRGGRRLSAVELQNESEVAEQVWLKHMAAGLGNVEALVAQSAPVDPTGTASGAIAARLKSHTVRNLSIAAPTSGPVSSSASVVDYSGVDAGLAATNFGTMVSGPTPRNVIPEYTTGTNGYSYFAHKGPDSFFGRSPVTLQQNWEKKSSSLGRQPESVRRMWFDAYGTVVNNREDHFGDLTGGSDGQALFNKLPPQGVSFSLARRGLESEPLTQSQLGEGVTELMTESLMNNLTDYIVDGRGINDSKTDSLMLGVTPRIVILAEEEASLVTEGAARLSESKSEAMPQLQQALPPSLTVAHYENGFAQLGTAVKGWEEYHQHWGFQRGESLARGTDAAPTARPALKELEELRQLVTDQQEGFKALREKTPGVEGKPLTEVDPEAAKQAQLALVRVSRELNRQQAVWYYREGYIRQLEATIAAAEQYAHVPENDFTTPEAQPLSTFGIDVDTASYSNVRRFIESNQLPPPDAVRIEELVNSFQYDGPKVEGEHPLAVAAEVSACPWQPQHQLLRVALKGKSIDLQQRPPARLVFLVDTSGSMSDENKLPLVKQSLRILVEQMREQDRLSIVTYSDNAGLLLDSTGGDKREAILAAIEGLHSDGSTNGEAGLKLAYEVAVKQFGEGATNRVMLCTDGDFNVGESADNELVKLIEKQRQTGVFLNIFGFGSGNLKDAKLEAIADKGNGQYIYIDGIKEARKTLLNELTGTLYTIAKDVKLQIEFNPNLVGSYRLVGYENRAMAAKDFSNDKVDSGDMGAGHSVVALYEIVPPGAPQPVAPQPEVEPLKYKRAGSVSARSENVAAADASTLTPSPSPGGRGEPEGKDAEVAQPAVEDPVPAAEKPADPLATELCTIRVRYKQPTSNESTKIETAVHHPLLLRGINAPTSRDHIWATAVAQFGLLTRHSTFVGTGNYSQVLELAQSAIGDDPTGQRREFVTLVRQTQHLTLKHEARLAKLSDHLEDHRRAIQQIKAVEQAPDLMTKASCSGKYKILLRQIEAPDDQPTYGEFKDYGRWAGGEYKTHKNLPTGYWVYVAPHWYIWGESTEQAAVDTTK